MGPPKNFKHFSKSNKHKKEQKALITQEDFYLAAIDCEEQADRWLLSDIKKCLRFYLKALEHYENGLTALDSTQEGKYNIYYNETRLFPSLSSPLPSPLLSPPLPSFLFIP